MGVALRMMGPLVKRRDPIAVGLLLAVFVAIGVMRWPLIPVLLTAIPLSIAVTWAVRASMKPTA
jgi:chromate transporter